MRNKYNNVILDSNLYLYYRLFRKYSYYANYKYIDSPEKIPLDVLPYKDFCYYATKYPNLWHKCELLYNSHRNKVKRVKARIQSMIYKLNDDLTYSINNCLFLTFTFNDDSLRNLSAKTRRTYVSRFLKNYSNSYVANIDFGDSNGREHYHAIVKCDKVVFSDWKCGILDSEKVVQHPERIAYYINKLSYHSVKDSCGFLIYSR